MITGFRRDEQRQPSPPVNAVPHRETDGMAVDWSRDLLTPAAPHPTCP